MILFLFLLLNLARQLAKWFVLVITEEFNYQVGRAGLDPVLL